MNTSEPVVSASPSNQVDPVLPQRSRAHASFARLLWWLGLATVVIGWSFHILVGVIVGVAMVFCATVVSRRSLPAYVGVGLWSAALLFNAAGAGTLGIVFVVLYLVQVNAAYFCRLPAPFSKLVEPAIRVPGDVEL